ncbi:MAG: TetR/AcrR family transcriptional regulator [Mobilitalea sp.]
MRNTKEKILNESLSLFSVKGYDGVSMTDIAGAVGIKAASIYKHYSAKEDIFNSIVLLFDEKTKNIFNPALLTNAEYMTISKETLIGIVQQIFRVYAEEPYLSKCRKLFMISAFHRSEIGDLYAKFFIEIPMQYQAELFAAMQKSNSLAKKDTSVMAYHFYTPILVLLQEYDYKKITLEEALKKIELLVTQFTEVYH